MLCEEVGRTVAPMPVIPVLVSAAGTLRRFANDALKEQWLGGIASGATLVTAALDEYNNDDPAAPGCTAKKVEGGYLHQRHQDLRQQCALGGAHPGVRQGGRRNWSWRWWTRAPPASRSIRSASPRAKPGTNW